MNRTLFIVTILILPWQAVTAEAPATVAGRSLEQYAELLNDPDRVVRLRAMRSLAPLGEQAGVVIARGLDHDDNAMRYLAAVQLGQIGGKPLDRAAERLSELADDERSLAVRMAASYALCELGRVDQHLPLLVESLQYPERGMACSAAELIGRLGPQAKAAIGALEAAYAKHRPGAKGGDYHIGGAALNALRQIRPASAADPDAKPVP